MSCAGTNYNEMGIEEATKNQVHTIGIRTAFKFITYSYTVNLLSRTALCPPSALHTATAFTVWHRTVSHSLNYESIMNFIPHYMYMSVCVCV